MSKLYTNLMVAAGAELDLNLGRCFLRFTTSQMKITLSLLQYAIMQACQFRIFRVFIAHAGKICAGVFYKIIFKSTFFGRKFTFYQSQIIFSKPMGSELFVELLGGKRCFGKNKDSFYRLIQTVYDGKLRLASGWII